MQENTTYRIRTTVNDHGLEKGETPCLRVPLQQTFNTLEILSLKLNQTNTYKFYTADYGVIVGRVYANGGFGVPNAKISVFIEVGDDDNLQSRLLYNYHDTNSVNRDGVQYNLLPDSVDSACHQVVGTFPNKRLVLDNNDVIEVFDKYWKYTTTTNASGDYMLFGIPTGQQTLHVNLDLSDCGVLSQRPRDLIGQGYNVNQFESPNKFKQSTNLKSLAQIYSEDRGLYVYPYWGETNESGDEIAITRCDIEISYKFEPTCIFMGSVITDKGSNAIGKNCTGDDKVGKMSDLATGEGSIEMIRKTIDGRVEEFPIRGNRLIDGDGVFCYQIPMNLDYVTTDEFGNMVPTDDPEKGIPTRTRVRFRISMDEAPSDATARKRCRYLVPNNPRMDKDNNGNLTEETERLNPDFTLNHQVDYEFGSSTKDESYRDLFWNKVYTVKNYIPRLQKNNNITNRKHTGIKLINHFGDNNPMPYNSLTIKLSFMYRLICVITKVIIYIIMMLNYILGVIMTPFCLICKILRGIGKIPFVGWVFKKLAKPFCAMVISCIKLSSEFCDDGINKKTFYPGCWGCQRSETDRKHNEEQKKIASTNPEDLTVAEYPQLGNADDSTLFTCVENSLAQENDATSFNFYNDWVNGVLYLPLWFRKITPKKKFLFGLFKRKAKDQWCDANKMFNQHVFQTCALERSAYGLKIESPLDGATVDIHSSIDPNDGCKKKKKCHEVKTTVPVQNGLVVTRETMMGQTVYYYQAAEYDSVAKDVVLLFATDIVLLGSLNDCDLDGTPQFYKSLEPTSFNQPTDILFTDTQIAVNDDGEAVTLDYVTFTEATGADWGNLNTFDECGKVGKDDDGGLFYGIGCNSIEMLPKTTLNLSRICEFGVTLDNLKYIPNLSLLQGTDDDSAYDRLIPDGFVSFDELFNHDERSMFATMNGNRLRTKPNPYNGLPSYDFRHYYINNFDGGLRRVMDSDLSGCTKFSYGKNAGMETASPDYYLFRMGERPYFYNKEWRLPRYENSFYFYFGLKAGKTAIEKFNSQFFAPCETVSGDELAIGIVTKPNDWCSELSDEALKKEGENCVVLKNGSVKIDLTGISTPYDLIINSRSDSSRGYELNEVNDEKICLAAQLPDEGDKAKGYILYDTQGPVTEECKAGLVLPNDDYELTVIDADGQIMSVFFSMGAKKVTFQTTVADFLVPNNVKSETYKDNGKKAASDAFQDRENNKIGGRIIVTRITDESLPAEGGKYLVTIKPDGELPNWCKDYTGNGFNITLTQDGIISGPANVPNDLPNDLPNAGVIDGQIVFGVPYGDFKYKIEITQLCGDDDDVSTPNTSSTTVQVGDPIPFKLYINDVDIDIFSKKDGDETLFNSGWSIDNNGKCTPNIGALSGWNELSIKSKYAWEKLTDYQKLKNREDELIEEQKTADADRKIEIDNELEELRGEQETFKDEYIEKIREAFWLTCPSESKELTFRVSTNQYPVTIQAAYDHEDYDGEVADLHILTNPMTDSVTKRPYLEAEITDTIPDIGIPTLTNFDNTTYGPKDLDYSKWGNIVRVNGNKKLCFGYDRTKGAPKRPYLVIVENGVQNTLPDKADLSKLSTYFTFHIIDKTMRLQSIAWSHVNGIPYFFGTNGEIDEDKNGKTITMNGLLAGWVYNGIADTNEETKETKFEEQLLGRKNVEINTINGDDDIPTKRFIHSSDGTEYPNYCIDGANDDIKPHYIRVENRNDRLSIEDSSCTIDETIYGRMSVRVNSSSLAMDKGDSALQLSVSNGDTNGTTRYFLFPYGGMMDFPYNRSVNGILSDNYGVLDYDVMLPIIQNPDKDHAIYPLLRDAESTWKNDSDEEITRGGYSDNGNFVMKRGTGQGRCFAVAVTENNCCAISPVLDFTQHRVVLGLLKDASGACRLGIKVSNVIPDKESATKILYYISAFAFTTEVYANVGTSPVVGSKEMLPVENYSEKADSLDEIQNKGKKDKTYAIETAGIDGQPSSWTVYGFMDGWRSDEDDPVSEPRTDAKDQSSWAGGRLVYRDNEGKIVQVVEIKWTGVVWATDVLDEADYVNQIQIEDGKETVPNEIVDDESPFTILTVYKPPIDNEDGTTTPPEYTYTNYSKTEGGEWVAIEETDIDPTLRHYEKWTEFSISEQQYNQLLTLSKLWGIGLSRIRDIVTVTVTDCTGLRHNCYIEKVVEETT